MEVKISVVKEWVQSVVPGNTAIMNLRNDVKHALEKVDEDFSFSQEEVSLQETEKIEYSGQYSSQVLRTLGYERCILLVGYAVATGILEIIERPIYAFETLLEPPLVEVKEKRKDENWPRKFMPKKSIYKLG